MKSPMSEDAAYKLYLRYADAHHASKHSPLLTFSGWIQNNDVKIKEEAQEKPLMSTKKLLMRVSRVPKTEPQSDRFEKIAGKFLSDVNNIGYSTQIPEDIKALARLLRRVAKKGV